MAQRRSTTATNIAIALAALAAGAIAGASLLPLGSTTPATAAIGTGASVWGANYFPNVRLTSHRGETVRFFDDLIAGKVVAINFIYTTCPDTCPLETARLLEVANILGDRVGKDVFFYSITIDPEVDTPAVLAAYAESWKAGDGWTFLTGDKADIDLLRKKLGLYIAEIQREGSKDHNLNLIIGNQSTGRWMKRSPFENPHVLATQLGSWLHNWKAPSTEARDYADAPELRTISAGEDLFRTRCASCHSIGGGDVARDAHRLGPDLLDVGAQRDRQWLTRWLAEPDKMLAEKDPLAMALLARYGNVPMPNLRLRPTDIRQLLDYIDEESRRIGALRVGAAARHSSRERGGDDAASEAAR